MAVLPLGAITLAAAPAQARQYAVVSAPRIDGFGVDEVRRLRPGTELSFTLYGTPGGRATLSIIGANRNLSLVETDPGQYEGTYTMGNRDRIAANSAVTANLRVGNVVASSVLSESLLRGVGHHPRNGQARARMAEMPRIADFDVRGDDELRAGNELSFMLRGTPGAKVELAIEGSRGVFFLQEERAGEYSGTYTIRRGDRIAPNSKVVATMRNGERVASANLSKSLLVAAAPAPAPRIARYCSNCATVEAVNVVQVSGDGNYLGTIGGGVVGALIGNQIGGGTGKTAATAAGAIGGAVVGRNIERNANKTQHTEVQVRYANGGTQVISYQNDPGLRVGDKVKVNDGVLTLDR